MASPVKGGAVLFSEMTPPEDGEDVFNNWYDNHHMPSHVQGVPGFLSGHRYRSANGPHYLAIYELDSPEALEHQGYRKRKFTPDAPTKAMLDEVTGFSRYIASERRFYIRDSLGFDPIDADVLIAVFFKVPRDKHNELMHWHETEHSPKLMENRGWLMVRHMEIHDCNPDPYTHLFLHYVRKNLDFDPVTFVLAHDTKRSHELGSEDWFMPKAVTYQKRGVRFLKNA